MVKQTLAEWRAEGIRRFGKDPANWAFRCPACGREFRIQEFLELGAGPNDAIQNCIGRFNGHMRPPNQADDGLGCDWAAYGLFQTLGKGRVVIAEDGSEVRYSTSRQGARQNADHRSESRRAAEDAQGVKEDVAILLEPLGDVRVLSVRAETPEQYRFDL